MFVFASFLGQGKKQDSTAIDSNLIQAVDTTVADSALEPGVLVEYKDRQVDQLIDLTKKMNAENCPELVRGYRVQIYSCSGGDCIDKASKYYNQFLIAFPDMTVYKMRQPPSIKVRVGDCRDRFEAEKIKAEIIKEFPGAFIVPDYIQTPYLLDCEEMEASDSTSVH